MPYDPNIPAPTDLLSDSQSDIQQNFNLANVYFGEDHVDFVAASDNGKHNKTTYVEQGVDPSTDANETAFYSKLQSGANEVFLRKESNGAFFQISGPDPINAVSGFSYLPGRMLYIWGTGTFAGVSQTTTVTMPTNGIIATTTLYQVVATFRTNAPMTTNSVLAVDPTAGGPNQFNANRSIGTAPNSFSYVATAGY